MRLDFTVSITPDLTTLFAALEGDVQAAIKAGLAALAGQIEAQAAKETPVRTSNLVNSISSFLTNNGMTGIIRAAAPYAEYVHEGTGLYGPHKQGIMRKRGSVGKGQKPNPFFTRAIAAINPQAVFEQGVQDYLSRRSA